MKNPLSSEERIQAVLTATPEQLEQIDSVLAGGTAAPTPRSIRLLHFTAAAENLGVGRSTVERMADDGTLPTVILRAGRRRIREADLRDIIFPEGSTSA